MTSSRSSTALIKELGGKTAPIYHDNLAKVSVVGVGMRTHTGVAQRMFKALADAKINIQNITTSEIKISCIIDKEDGNKALQIVHDAFELEKVKYMGGSENAENTKVFLISLPCSTWQHARSMRNWNGSRRSHRVVAAGGGRSSQWRLPLDSDASGHLDTARPHLRRLDMREMILRDSIIRR